MLKVWETVVALFVARNEVLTAYLSYCSRSCWVVKTLMSSFSCEGRTETINRVALNIYLMSLILEAALV